MPVYEYYCKSCDGIFETIRPIAKSSEPAPCPACAKKGERIPPTSFAAFTMRDGYPRSIPDRGTYWHLGKEVKHRISGPVRPNEHPEINKPRPKRLRAKGELSAIQDRQRMINKENEKRIRDRVMPLQDPRRISKYRDD